MKSAELVNLILDKLRTGRVEFVRIEGMQCEFIYGSVVYVATSPGDKVLVYRRTTQNTGAVDNYSRWVEGVLNGKSRNEAGELVEVKSYE